MQVSCSQCSRTIGYRGDRPSFCPGCGSSLGEPVAIEPANDVDPVGLTIALDEPSAEVDPDATTVHDPRPFLGLVDGSMPGQVAGYRLLARLGVGGMGTVHEAEELATGRRVALKLIAPELVTSEVAVERFLQEGRLASAIAHPRCVFVMGADQHEGRPYLVMELMPGATLKDLVLGSGPLAPEQAVAKILDVVDGLREAHRLGVLHRDVKPSNCFLQADGRVKVGDFGLSKALGGDPGLTRSGAFLGTPLYASPEQVRGEPLDARTDVYSVAATLYYLLTGRAPFEGGDAAATLAKIVADPAPSPRALRPEIPKGLEAVVLAGLERQRDRRPRDLDEYRAWLLPFVPDRLSIGGIGLRLAAYIFDMIVVRFVVIFLINAMDYLIHDRIYSPRTNSIMVMGLDVALFIIYFVIFETRTGASPAKRLMRLRVYQSDAANTPGIGRGLLRAAVFFAIILVPADVYNLFYMFSDEEQFTLGPTWSLRLAGLVLLASTMRARNGYRGVHEWISGTRVVRLPAPERARKAGHRRPGSSPISPPLIRPGGLPEVLGSFRVEGALHWGPARGVLRAVDPALDRPVWIVFRGEGVAQPGDSRRDLGRVARPRWLGGGEHDGRCWDAFVAPPGRPLAELVAADGPFSWHDTRPILVALAEELALAEADGTLPEDLNADQVWFQPDGDLQLLDVAPVDPPARTDASRRELRLMVEVATLALTGRSGPDGLLRPFDIPLPVHARTLLGRLRGERGGYERLAEFRADLDATRDRRTELGPQDRLARLGMFASLGVVYLAIQISAMAVLAYALTSHFQGRSMLRMGRGGSADSLIEVYLAFLPLATPLFWAAWAFCARGGWTRRIANLALVRDDGSTPSRLRCAVREGLLWAIASALSSLVVHDEGTTLGDIPFPLTFLATLVGLSAYAAFGVLSGRRMPHEFLSKTTVVPR